MNINRCIATLKQRIEDFQCSVVIDLDETIFYPLERLHESITSQMDVSFSLRDVELAGSLDKYFAGKPRYDEFVTLAEKLRADESLYVNLPVLDGAIDAIYQLSSLPGLCLCGYMTARPSNTVRITRQELRRIGLPILPILARERDIPFLDTVRWKLNILDEISNDYQGSLIMIDDNPDLALSLLERNTRNTDFIVSILFNGPLTRAFVKNKGITTNSSRHFFVADWSSIPNICQLYTKPVKLIAPG